MSTMKSQNKMIKNVVDRQVLMTITKAQIPIFFLKFQIGYNVRRNVGMLTSKCNVRSSHFNVIFDFDIIFNFT